MVTCHNAPMLEWIAETAVDLDERIRPTVLETPLVERTIGERPVWCKQENLQRTGSFKIRGAMAKLLSLSEAERDRGVITASTGNHGAAVASAGRVLNTQVTVYAPESADPSKLAAITAAGAALETVPGDPLQAELMARRTATAAGVAYVPPYNDRAVMAGQATVGVELVRQLGEASTVIVSVGGGGLISGIGAVVKRRWPDVQLVAASPENSAAMHDSVAAGRIVEVATRSTLSDGTAGGVEPAAVTFDTCRRLVDTWLTVSERDIAVAMVSYLDSYDDRIEGSAAVSLAVAAMLGNAGPTVVILCGGNASVEVEATARRLAIS
jgi:threonine dehydratase